MILLRDRQRERNKSLPAVKPRVAIGQSRVYFRKVHSKTHWFKSTYKTYSHWSGIGFRLELNGRVDILLAIRLLKAGWMPIRLRCVYTKPGSKWSSMDHGFYPAKQPVWFTCSTAPGLNWGAIPIACYQRQPVDIPYSARDIYLILASTHCNESREPWQALPLGSGEVSTVYGPALFESFSSSLFLPFVQVFDRGQCVVKTENDFGV